MTIPNDDTILNIEVTTRDGRGVCIACTVGNFRLGEFIMPALQFLGGDRAHKITVHDYIAAPPHTCASISGYRCDICFGALPEGKLP